MSLALLPVRVTCEIGSAEPAASAAAIGLHYSCVQLFCSCVAEPAFDVASTLPSQFYSWDNTASFQVEMHTDLNRLRPRSVPPTEVWGNISNYCIPVRVHYWSRQFRPALLSVCLMASVSLPSKWVRKDRLTASVAVLLIARWLSVVDYRKVRQSGS